jgi:hypothetical protein
MNRKAARNGSGFSTHLQSQGRRGQDVRDVDARYYRNGKPYQEATKFKKGQKGRAQALLKRREGDIANGVPVTPATLRLTFDQAVADVVTDYRINGKRTLAHVERRINLHLTPYFGGKRLAEITTAHIRAFNESGQAFITEADGTIAPGASNAEINRELAIVKRACRLAMQGGTLIRAPHIPMLEEQNVRQGFFERDAFEALRSHLPEALKPVMTFAYLTGSRAVRGADAPMAAGRSEGSSHPARAWSDQEQ